MSSTNENPALLSSFQICGPQGDGSRWNSICDRVLGLFESILITLDDRVVVLHRGPTKHGIQQSNARDRVIQPIRRIAFEGRTYFLSSNSSRVLMRFLPRREKVGAKLQQAVASPLFQGGPSLPTRAKKDPAQSRNRADKRGTNADDDSNRDGCRIHCADRSLTEVTQRPP